MAVAKSKVTTAMVLKVKTGTLNGKDVFKNLTFKRIKDNAAEADVFELAGGIAKILASPVSSIYIQEVNELTNA